VLAVELFNSESLVIRDDDQPSAEIHEALPGGATRSLQTDSPSQTAAPVAVTAGAVASTLAAPPARQSDQVIDDPLGQELGSQRILRVSPLTPVRAVC
jgi:hypothetical protein